jgi:hypothetical protein
MCYVEMDGNNYDATQIIWSEINIHFDLFL